jgi:hypothetical protein
MSQAPASFNTSFSCDHQLGNATSLTLCWANIQALSLQMAIKSAAISDAISGLKRKCNNRYNALTSSSL